VDWLATSNALENLSGVKALLLYFLFSTLYFLAEGQKIGVKGFEPSASTSRTQATRVRTADKQTTCDDDREPLHQWLHQLADLLHADDGLEWLAAALKAGLSHEQILSLIKHLL